MIAWGRIEGETCHKESQTFFYFPFAEIASNFRYFCEKCRNNVHLTVKITINHNSTFTHSHIVGGEVCVCFDTPHTFRPGRKFRRRALCPNPQKTNVFQTSSGKIPRSISTKHAMELGHLLNTTTVRHDSAKKISEGKKV